MTDPGLTNFESMIGKLIVEQGLASSSEVEECLELFLNRKKKKSPDRKERTLSDFLLAKEIVTKRQLEQLILQTEESKPSDQQIPGYEVIKKLGEGAMAKVYLARQISLDRLVAIKILPKKYSKNQEWVKRFSHALNPLNPTFLKGSMKLLQCQLGTL